MLVILQAACALAAFAHSSRKLLGIMSLTRGSPCGQRKRCSKWFTTNLLLSCRLPATRII
ncbi:hypothetical protein A6J64_014005 [Yersinia enterocolitica]|nr:hypothetical protein A6J64_014005 [Yersinia enterocolitica]PNM20220.1 hypothetical protein A6J65_016025 [Yersinia enterocolitica]PNM22703.1 hypothetical protein A6J63_007830 [Yersinia enterocolitica]